MTKVLSRVSGEEACSRVMRPSKAGSRNLDTRKEGLLEDASARSRIPIKDGGPCQMMAPEIVGCGASCAEGNRRRQQVPGQNLDMREHHWFFWQRNCVPVLTKQDKHSHPGLSTGSPLPGLSAGVVDSRWWVPKLVKGKKIRDCSSGR